MLTRACHLKNIQAVILLQPVHFSQLLNSFKICASMGAAPLNTLQPTRQLILKTQRHHQYSCRLCASACVPVRGLHVSPSKRQTTLVKASKYGRRKDWVSSATAKANFFNLPGMGGEKRKIYAERKLLGFSMEQMYAVVSDVDKYQDFLPWCQKSLVKTRRKGHIVADMVVGFPPLVESYTSSVTLTKPHLIKAECTQGKLFNNLITTWKFSPGLRAKPNTCIVDFHVSFEFRSMLTSNLANVFFNEVVRVMAGAFYEEAKRRYGVESIPSRKISSVVTSDNEK